MTKFLITGYYGLKNIGDEAILSGIITSLREIIKEVELSVVTCNSDETANMHNVNPIQQSFTKGFKHFMYRQFTHCEMLKVYKSIKGCDVFILGGGELLQDLKAHYLPILLSLLYIAKKHRKRTMVYGIGAGPIETKFGKMLCNKILNTVDLITVRDEKSKIALEQCNVTKVKITADPAFTIKMPTEEQIEKYLVEVGINRNKSYIGVTLHNQLYCDDIYRKCNRVNVNVNHRRVLMGRIVDGVIEKYQKSVIFIPTTDVDYYGYLEVVKRMKFKGEVIVVKPNSDFNYVVSLTSILDILIGMRLHSLIIASMVGIPFLPLSYSSKVKGFVDLLGLNELYMDIENIEQNNFIESFNEKFRTIWENRTVYGWYLKERSNHFKEKAYENANLLNDLLSDGVRFDENFTSNTEI